MLLLYYYVISIIMLILDLLEEKSFPVALL